MDPKRIITFQAFLLVLVAGLAASATIISDSVFSSHGSGGRNLLQTRTSCPVNFESMNYTIITSKCKGPQYVTKLCCESLKEFACPYAEDINDGTNDCATTMFSYINLYGKYPPGLFASHCTENKDGLSCPEHPPGASQKDSVSGASATRIAFPLISLASLLVLGFIFS